MRLSFLLTMREQITGPLRRVRAAFRNMASRAGIDMARVNAAMERLRANAHKVGQAIGRTMRAGIIATTGAIAAASAGIIRYAADIEQIEAALERFEGGAAGARKRMAWIEEFAARTPYGVQELASAFSRLRTNRITEAERALRSLGDASSSMPGTTVEQAVDALADARRNEFERLKEFGIVAERIGGKVRFTMGDIVETVTGSGDAIERGVLDVLDKAFGGGMDRQSRTFYGQWSNFTESIAAAGLQVARAGMFDAVKGQLARLVSWLDGMKKGGKLDAWAKKISDGVVGLVDFLASVNWQAVGRDIGTIGSAISTVAGWISYIGNLGTNGGFLEGLFNVGVIAVIAKLGSGVGALAIALGAAAAPATAIVALVTAIASAAFLIWRNWSRLPRLFQIAVEAIMKVLNPLQTVIDGVTSAVGFLNRLGTREPSWMGGRRTARTSTSGLGPRIWAAGKPMAARGPVRDVGPSRSELSIRLLTDRGVTARVEKAKAAPSQRMDISQKRGPVALAR